MTHNKIVPFPRELRNCSASAIGARPLQPTALLDFPSHRSQTSPILRRPVLSCVLVWEYATPLLARMFCDAPSWTIGTRTRRNEVSCGFAVIRERVADALIH